MSRSHPIVAVTGSSGAGTTGVKMAFEQVFRKESINAAFVEGDSFHRFDRQEMDRAVAEARASGGNITHFGPEGNLFSELDALFHEYSEVGTGRRRFYIHNEEKAARSGYPAGSITPWEPLPHPTDLLFYEGLHGGLVCEKYDIAAQVDLLIGVVPIINLEWMQKIHRDKAVRGYTRDDATRMILGRMHDYVHYITPQFSRTHINFQRVPTVDTSNPFAAEEIPTNDQSFVVIHIRDLKKMNVDFRYLLEMLQGSFMSAPDTIVVPAGKMIFAMQLIITPVIARMMKERDTGP
jgi:phosphoribulokinase